MSLYLNDLFMYVSFHSVYLWGADTSCPSSLICIAAAQSLGCVQLLAILWTAACPSLSPWVCSNSSLLRLSQWCHPTISSFIGPFSSCPQFFLASGFFSNESALGIRWPKYWSFSISPSNEYSGLISSRVDWFDLAQILKNLLTDW